jgi:hypothetical protein
MSAGASSGDVYNTALMTMSHIDHHNKETA